MPWSQLLDGLRSLGGAVGNGRESPPEDVRTFLAIALAILTSSVFRYTL